MPTPISSEGRSTPGEAELRRAGEREGTLEARARPSGAERFRRGLTRPEPAQIPDGYGDASSHHVLFLNPQGGIAEGNPGLGSHPDFGGQLVYVAETAQAMARAGAKVDIVTRQFEAEEWPQFALPEGQLPAVTAEGQSNPVRILRVPAGPRGFLPKERLWPHLSEWALQTARIFQNEGTQPSALTAHYGDGGLAGVLLEPALGTPFATFTGHSLGAQKQDALAAAGKDLSGYNFDQRLDAERAAIGGARAVVVSTRQERDEQYGHPEYGRAVGPDTRFEIIPPGVNWSVFGPRAAHPEHAEAVRALRGAIRRDISHDRRGLPFIVLSGRLDEKKNYKVVAEAFRRNPELREKANLLLLLKGGADLFAGEQLSAPEKAIAQELGTILRDAEMLPGGVAVPGLENTQLQLSAIYRELARGGQGIFVHPALIEPFGLMPLEAAAAGLPVVATKNGGPSESFDGGKAGLLFDPTNPDELAAKLSALVGNPGQQRVLSERAQDRVEQLYTWDSTAHRYLDVINDVVPHRRGA